MEKAADEQAEKASVTHSQPLAELCSYMIERRDYLPYMEVARAMVVQAFLLSEAEAIDVADGLDISRQTRHNWLKKDLNEWAAAWERRRRARDPIPLGTIKPKEYRISDDDWEWIAKTVKRAIRTDSWATKAAMVRSAAREAPAKAHLTTISRVTLWRARGKISALEALAEAKSSDTANPIVSLPPEEFIEPEAVVVPFLEKQSDFLPASQQTGNPF